MHSLPEVTRIEHVSGYTYRVWFDDGAMGDVDFAHYIGRGPVFEAFRDMDYFKQARVEAGTIAWPGGVDLAPERLYEQVQSAMQRN